MYAPALHCVLFVAGVHDAASCISRGDARHKCDDQAQDWLEMGVIHAESVEFTIKSRDRLDVPGGADGKGGIYEVYWQSAVSQK